MKRLTNDNPQDNMENALNLFYAKDSETWVRSGGDGPDYADISLYNFIRKIAKEHPDASIPSGTEDEIGDCVCEQLMEGTETIEGIVALLYTAGWAFAELHARLKRYEDASFDADGRERISFDRLAEICAAEKDRRLATFPCKVGDKIFIINKSNEIITGTVIGFCLEEHDGYPEDTIHYKTNSCTCALVSMYQDNILRCPVLGKQAFLSEEDAKMALSTLETEEERRTLAEEKLHALTVNSFAIKKRRRAAQAREGGRKGDGEKC